MVNPYAEWLATGDRYGWRKGEMYGIEYFPERFVAAIRSLKETDNDPA